MPLYKRKRSITIQTIFNGSVPLTQAFNETLRGDYVSNGVGMFNVGTGTINIVIPAGSTIEKAFLYWDVIRFNGVPAQPNPSGNLNGQPVNAQLISTVSILSNFVDGFRADVTGIAVSGLNNLTGFPITTEGAGLVIVYSGLNLPCKTVIINEGNTVFENETVSTTFQSFTAAGSPPQARTTYIVGDGESGGDNAIFNGTTVAGPNAFNSADGPFFDTLEPNINGVVNGGDTTATASIQSTGDNLVWLAQVFSVTSSACPQRGIEFFSVI